MYSQKEDVLQGIIRVCFFVYKSIFSMWAVESRNTLMSVTSIRSGVAKKNLCCVRYQCGERSENSE
jgi:hypothetical protein